MKDTELRARLIGLGMPRDKADEVAAKIRDDIHPKAAVASLAIMKVSRVEPGLSGTGGQALSMASTGMKVGSYFGPIGSAIGAAVGAIAGALIHTGTAPQRTAEALKMIADIRSLPVDFTGRLLTWDQFTKMIYAIILNNANFPPGFKNWHTWEGGSLTAHPTALTNLALTTFEVARTVMKAANAAPVGNTVSVKLYMGPNKSYPCKGDYTFTNPGVSGDPATDYTRIVKPALYWMEQQRDPQHARESVDHPDAEHVLRLATDKLIAELQPATVSTVIANAPVALLPKPLVAQGMAIAAPYIRAGVAPSISLPPVPPPTVMPLAPGQPMPRQDITTVAPPASLPADTAYMALPPTTLVPSPTQDTTAGIMQNLVSQDTGVNLTSPAARQVLADVAADGVEKTPAGPKAPTPSWVIPTGLITALALLR